MSSMCMCMGTGRACCSLDFDNRSQHGLICMPGHLLGSCRALARFLPGFCRENGLLGCLAIFGAPSVFHSPDKDKMFGGGEGERS